MSAGATRGTACVVHHVLVANCVATSSLIQTESCSKRVKQTASSQQSETECTAGLQKRVTRFNALNEVTLRTKRRQQ